MIEYCIDKDGVISGASKEDLEIFKERMLARIKDDIELLCSVTFALGKAEIPAVNPCVLAYDTMGLGYSETPFLPRRPTPLSDTKSKFDAPVPEYSPIDSPAEYRRKMNEPWPEPVTTDDDLEREFDEASAYEEHLDDSSKEVNLDDMYTKGMKAYTVQPRGLNSLLSGDPGVTFGAI